MNDTLEVCERFCSLQGESSYAGMGCYFIRLAGCNLRCRYCDSAHAVEKSGTLITVDVLVDEAVRTRVPLIEVTGGEPLLQVATPRLLRGLSAIPGRTVLIETNGSLDISEIPSGVVAVVDVKCPDSGAADSFDMVNLARLRPQDELKFVIGSRRDYEWARQFVRQHAAGRRGTAVHFSPVAGTEFSATELASWIVDDGLNVRLQLQVHRMLQIR